MGTGTKSFRARRAKILAEWNDGATKANLMEKYALEEQSFNSIFRNAHAKGIYVRDVELFRVKRKKPKGTGMTRRMRQAQPGVKAMKAVEQTKRKSVSARNSEWWAKRLPEKLDQCRWPSGDLSNHTLRFCCHRRADAHIPLAMDTLPYCEHHRQTARRRYPQKDVRESGERAKQVERELEMA